MKEGKREESLWRSPFERNAADEEVTRTICDNLDKIKRDVEREDEEEEENKLRKADGLQEILTRELPRVGGEGAGKGIRREEEEQDCRIFFFFFSCSEGLSKGKKRGFVKSQHLCNLKGRSRRRPGEKDAKGREEKKSSECPLEVEIIAETRVGVKISRSSENKKRIKREDVKRQEDEEEKGEKCIARKNILAGKQ